MIEIPTMKTIKETAKDFNLPEHFVRTLCKSGKICCVRAGAGTGSKYLINQQKFAEYLNSASEPDDTSETGQGKIRRIGA